MTASPYYGGFWRRVAAYLIDAIPITMLTAVSLWSVTGTGQALRQYAANRSDVQARANFIEKRNVIRNCAAFALVVYGSIMEASPLQGTLGKRALGMRVVTTDGRRMAIGRSMVRNVAKLFGLIPAFIGALWAAFDPRAQALHDKAVGTLVIVQARPEGG